MEPENSGSTVALQIKRQSFLSSSLQLKALDRALVSASTAAVTVLQNMLEDKDPRVRMQAAVKLLEFGIDVKKAISQDQMQRLVAEIKLNGNGGTKELELRSGGAPRPLVDFGTIRPA